MRTIPPEADRQPPAADQPAERELIFRLILPLRLFGDVFFLGILMGRDPGPGVSPEQGRLKGNITAAAILILLLCVVLSGSFFLLYLIKALLGLDLFTDAHLLE
ncbi:hypothetical protein [Desulfoluna butyratoxydans]|uniref:Uncharacterized protein n=1 Tax=Desulfoluna butyratoxydans TaxID=231438 RepID=A0A4U8YT06_9BACT|nr:hypothetical protein [Desulfoluna butyratoxydans]VFQ46489.1 hypothetical protein MSL71_41560 [Desulfoluna butyratoxydans]